MCILRVRRYVEEDGRALETSSSWVICENGNLRESCPNYQRREQLIRVPIGSALSSPGLMAHDTTSSSASSMPSTPTSGPRFDIREPFKNSFTGNPLRHGNPFRRSLPADRHASRNDLPRPIISQPNPPSAGGRPNRAPLPSRIRDHRRAYSDSEYEERMSAPNSSDRAPEIFDRNAAREAARKERRRFDESRRKEEEKEERETALDEEERRTQRKMQDRERLRELERQRHREEDRRQEREDREAREREEREELARARRRRADQERMDQLKREIGRDKEQERWRREHDEEEQRHRRDLEELLDEERRRKERKAHLERELQYYQELEARLDLAERHRAEEEQFSRHAQEVEAARRARESRKAENARQQRQHQTELDEELRRLKEVERRLNAARQPRQQYGARTPPTYVQPPPRGGNHPFITQGRPHSQTLESLLRQQPSSILNENVRRAHGENVLDQARQDAERAETAEYQIPLRRRNTISGRERERETQYRSMRRYP